MPPFFSAVIYAALHRRTRCGHCASLDHHRRVGRDRFICRNCRREFTIEHEKR